MFLASDYDTIWLVSTKHVWYFEPILEHILFSFVVHLQATWHMFLFELVVLRTNWKSSVWSSIDYVNFFL